MIVERFKLLVETKTLSKEFQNKKSSNMCIRRLFVIENIFNIITQALMDSLRIEN